MDKPKVLDKNKPGYKPVRTPIGGDTTKFRRLPIFSPRDRMAFPEDPRKYRLWVTDVKNQVQDYLDSGFQFVMRKDIDWVGEGNPDSLMGGSVCMNVGRADVKDNAMAYLMEIDMAVWEVIRNEYHKGKREVLEQLKRDTNNLKQSEDFYGPGLDIK